MPANAQTIRLLANHCGATSPLVFCEGIVTTFNFQQ